MSTGKNIQDSALQDLNRLAPDGESTTRLLRRARSGDEQALDQLYRRYLLPLQRWSRGRLPVWARDLVDTDDLVQDTLLSSLRGVQRFQPRYAGAFHVYLRQSIRNRIRDQIRRAHREPREAGASGKLVDPRPLPIAEAIGREAMKRFEDALQRVRSEDREAVVARVELGLDYRQVAAALGKPSPDAARMAVSRALLRLAKEMAGSGP